MKAEAEGACAGALTLKEPIMDFKTRPFASSFVDPNRGGSCCPLLGQDGCKPWDFRHDAPEAMKPVTVAKCIADVGADEEVVGPGDGKRLSGFEHGFCACWQGDAKLLWGDHLPDGRLNKVKNDASGQFEGSFKQEDGSDGAIRLEQWCTPTMQEVACNAGGNEGGCP